MTVHIALDELADASAGLLDPGRAREIDRHVQTCAQCSRATAALSEVGALLSAEPAPTMPDHVFDRLDRIVADESARRAAVPSGPNVGHPTPQRLRLANFGEGMPPAPKKRFVAFALVACAAAGIVGFAGYFLSATAGLNEPSMTAPAVLNSRQLGEAASSLKKQADLSPHRFSQAWRCARGVTDGRITALRSAVVDGTPALLVYTESDGTNEVTVVTGCARRAPLAGPSTTLPR